MAEPLQNKALIRKLHIALFLFVILIAKSSQAQSLLLPGDIVFVSVSSTSDTFEFIPLINLEEGTEFSVSNGLWNREDQKFADDQTIFFKVSEPVLAGTPIRVGAEKIKAIETRGVLNLSEKAEQLFLYQKDNEIFRFVTAVGWGEKSRRRDKSFLGSEIPDALKETPNAILRLGSSNNYQYYLRYGASGTPKMLLGFVSNPGFWRGNEEIEFSPFGTSFNILSPPVILFDESFSSVKENSSSTSLQVAIYEHDGSKLTVDVVFDTAFSSIDREELDGFVSKQINFTGLIGNAVYEIAIPVSNDGVYEGNETGIFNLQNLSSGRFGDFISHSVIISDDEIPEIKLEVTDEFGENILLVHNLERKGINLKNWEITKGDTKIVFPEDTYLKVGESLVLIADKDYESSSISGQYFNLNREDSKILNSAGSIQLNDQSGKKITEVYVSKKEDLPASNLVTENRTGSLSSSVENAQNVTGTSEKDVIVIPGWKSFKASDANTSEYPSVEFYYWSEPDAKFLKVDEEILEVPKDAILTGYFDEVASLKVQKAQKANKVVDEINFSLSASDSDENGRIQSSEGLNLIKNTSNGTLSTEGLISLINNKLGTKNSVSIYSASPGFNRISINEDDDNILAGQSFWVKIDEEVEKQNISINLQELSNYEKKINEEVEKGILEFEVKGSSKTTGFTFSFLPEDINPENTLNLKMREELYLTEFNEIVLVGMVSEDHYSSFQVSRDLNNIVQIPLHFTSSKSGEFEISLKSWTDIPDGWVISIEDVKEEKSYEINENWSIKFNYSNTSSVDEEKLVFPTIEDRFVLKVIPEALVDRSEEDEIPKTVELHQNYPNPFNPATTISFFMPEEAEVKLSVFNIVGQPVAVLLQEKRSQGEHTFEWDASDMPSGIYIYQLEVGTKIMTRKMTLVK